jgi:hypothetical protein
LALVDGLPPGDALTADELAGLSQVMRQTTADPLIRNNIANRLVDRSAVEPGLWRDFAAMQADTAEEAVWRDYSIQFLALALPAADDRPAAAARLLDIARQDAGTMGTTALIQLARLARTGVIARPADLADLIVARARDRRVDDPVRHTAFALLGEEGLRDHLPLVRAELADPAGPDATRGALFALGRLGEAADAALLDPFCRSANGAIAEAARRAQARLREPRSPLSATTGSEG